MKSIASPILIQQIIDAITPHYEPSEARAIAFRCLDLGWNLSSMDIILKKEVDLPVDWDLRLGRLAAGEPLQYVMGKTYFRDHLFQVNADTLIPRPETEELVDLVLRHAPGNASVLDVGTGSGCIPISLKLERPSLSVEAWDISSGALTMARQNAQSLAASVEFKLQDIFSWQTSQGSWDMIVSNPPFYSEDFKTNNEQRDLARFQDAMPFEDLVEAADLLLSENGVFAVIIPNRIPVKFITI